MSTRPIHSVFGVPEPPPSQDSAVTPQSSATESATETETEWVNSELVTIASTIEELQSRLEQANTRLSSAAQVETTEVEIGRLFVEAQRFAEASLADLDHRINGILCEAEAKAKQILAEATEEAHEIRRHAQHAAFASMTTTRELQSAIAGFTAVNGELLKELGALNSMLAPPGERGIGEFEWSSGLPEGH